MYVYLYIIKTANFYAQLVVFRSLEQIHEWRINTL
jgi:hypothetical protein